MAAPTGGKLASFYVDKASFARYRFYMRQLGINAARPEPFLTVAAAIVEREIKWCFINERDPSGKPWKKLAESTKSGRRKGKKRRNTRKGILRDTGILWRSRGREKSLVPPAVAVGFSDIKAVYHFFGVRGAGRAHNVTIAARKMLPEKFNYHMRQEMFRALKSQLRRRMGGHL